MRYKLIGGLICVALVILFVIQNSAVVEVRFLFWSIAMSRSLLIFMILVLGIVTGWLFHSFMAHGAKKP